jgi:hypothetical protein
LKKKLEDSYDEVSKLRDNNKEVDAKTQVEEL